MVNIIFVAVSNVLKCIKKVLSSKLINKFIDFYNCRKYITNMLNFT